MSLALYSRFYLASSCFPTQWNGIIHRPRHVQLPSLNEITNEMKYFLFQMVDEWKKNCISDTLHHKITKLNLMYEKGYLKFQLISTHLQELQNAYENEFGENNTYIYNLEGERDLEIRYSLRIAEMKRQKEEWKRKLIEIRIQIFSIVCYPIVKTMFQIFRCAKDDMFTQFMSSDYVHVISHAFQWITNVTDPDIPFLKGVATTFTQCLEQFIDYRMQLNSTLFKTRGYVHFQNICCSDFMYSIEYYKNQREAFYFLLCALRYQKIAISSRKSQSEILMMQCRDVVYLIASFLCTTYVLDSPKVRLWN